MTLVGRCCLCGCPAGVGVTGVAALNSLGLALSVEYGWQFPTGVEQYALSAGGEINRREVALVYATYDALPDVDSARSFVTRGGTLVLESAYSHTSFSIATTVNDFLEDLGVTMRQLSQTSPGSLESAEYLEFQAHALTANCSKFNLGGVLAGGSTLASQHGRIQVNDGESLARVPASSVDVIAVESLGSGRVVLIAARNPVWPGDSTDLNTGTDRDDEQFFVNLYNDAAGDCSTSCTTLGFFGNVDPDDWSLTMPQGSTFVKSLGDDDLTTSGAHTIFMGYHPYDASFSIPADSTDTAAYLSDGGTVVLILGGSHHASVPSPLTDTIVDDCNTFLEDLGLLVRWRKNGHSGNDWYAADLVANDGIVAHSDLYTGSYERGLWSTIYAATPDEVYQIYVGFAAGSLEGNGALTIANGYGVQSKIIVLDTSAGGRFVVIAASAFFTGAKDTSESAFSAVGNEDVNSLNVHNNVLLRNLLALSQCPEVAS